MTGHLVAGKIMGKSHSHRRLSDGGGGGPRRASLAGYPNPRNHHHQRGGGAGGGTTDLSVSTVVKLNSAFLHALQRANAANANPNANTLHAPSHDFQTTTINEEEEAVAGGTGVPEGTETSDNNMGTSSSSNHFKKPSKIARRNMMGPDTQHRLQKKRSSNQTWISTTSALTEFGGESNAWITGSKSDDEEEFDNSLPQDRQELMSLVNNMLDERKRVEIEFANDILGVTPNNKNGNKIEEDETEKSEESEEEEWHTPFAENIYTLFYMCACDSYAFWYAIFVYSIQIITISLTLEDVTNFNDSTNPFGIPSMVDGSVTATQAITLLLALAYQSDFIEALLKLQDGWYEEVLIEHPGATYNTWLWSCFAQLVAGLSLLLTIFVLTMQADNVLSMMTNFAALHFMAEIDDIGFSLARMGFVRTQLQQEAEAVVNFEVPLRRSRNYARRVLYICALICLFAGFGVLKKNQIDGKYLQTYVYVQFGDDHNPKLTYYSGLFVSKDDKTSRHREYYDLDTKSIRLAYCIDESAWTFSEASASPDPCEFFARSKSTSTYDVTTIPNSDWEVLDSDGKLQPFFSFSLIGRDCDKDSCNGKCTKNGLCECPHDRFGMDCEFSDVCPELAMETSLSPFPVLSHSQWSGGVGDDFQLLTHEDRYVKVYNMPVYYSSRTIPANIIFFGGGRWVLTSEADLIDLEKAKEKKPNRDYFPELTAAVLEKDFHGYHHAKYSPFLLSDRVEFNTADYHPTPSGLSWWTVKAAMHPSLGDSVNILPGTSVDSQLTCKACIEGSTEGCDSVGGVCNESTGRCDCNYGYKGKRCDLQIACFEEDNPCGGKGSCDEVSGVCQCDFPYHGKLCDSKVGCNNTNDDDDDEKASGSDGEGTSCKNGGVCDASSGRCDCGDDPAIYGDTCEKKADCHSLGCENGGICSATGECVCRHPFKGRLCSLVDKSLDYHAHFCSQNEDCNNGTCDVGTGICSCDNPSAYGALCEHQFNCGDAWYNCLNGGTCNEDSGLCECPSPYFGADCAKVEPCSSDSQCMPGGTDFPVESKTKRSSVSGRCDVSTGLCHCKNGPEAGKTCERDNIEDCRLVGCAEGECNSRDGRCECSSPYGGLFCEAIVGDLPAPEDSDGVTANALYQILDECLERWGFPPVSWIIADEECRGLIEESYGVSRTNETQVEIP